MKLGFSIKLGIVVVLAFGLLLGALLLYKPLQVRYHASKFNSGDIKVRVAGVDALLRLGAKGKEAIAKALPGGSEAAALLIKSWNGKDPALNSQQDINSLPPESGAFLAGSPLLQTAKREYAETVRLILAKHGRLTRDHARIFNGKGLDYQGRGDNLTAWAYYNLALIIDPKFKWAYNNRGNIKADLKDYDEAFKDFSKAIRLDPKFATAYANRGNLKRIIKKYDEALEDCNKAVEIDNNSTLARRNRVAIYLETMNLEGALPDYNKRVEDNPKSAFHRVERGYLFFDCGRFVEAEVDFRKIIELNGSEEEQALYAFFRICLINIRNGFAVLARKEAKEYLKGYEGEQEWGKTVLSFFAGRISEVDMIKATIDVKERPVLEQKCEAYYYIAEMRLASGNVKSAKKLYEKCVATGVTNYTEHRSSRCELKRIAEREKK